MARAFCATALTAVFLLLLSTLSVAQQGTNTQDEQSDLHNLPIATCPMNTTTALNRSCVTGGSDIVCSLDGTEYRNAACAVCHGVVGIVPGKCPEVVATCTSVADMQAVRACVEGTQDLVCGTSMITYRNIHCLDCSGDAYLRTGVCANPAPPIVDTCSSNTTCGLSFLDACQTQDASYVCHNGTTYKNAACAMCNDVPRSAAGTGRCYSPPAQPSPFFEDCPESAPPALKSACSASSVDPVCGWDGVTYRSHACAVCNNVRAPTAGTCVSSNVSDVHCRDGDCGVNAHCVRDVVDCDFETPCAWGSVHDLGSSSSVAGDGTSDTESAVSFHVVDVSASNNIDGVPSVDHTYMNRTRGHYIVASAHTRARLQSLLFSTRDPVTHHACHVAFAYAFSGVGAHLDVFAATASELASPTLVLSLSSSSSSNNNNNNSSSTSPNDNSTATAAQVWSTAHVPAEALVGVGEEVVVRFALSYDEGGAGGSNSSSVASGVYVALDDIALVCDGVQEHVCRCDDGFHNSAAGMDSDVLDCRPIEGDTNTTTATATAESNAVSVCRAGATCEEVLECEQGAPDLVCAAGTHFKNRACAKCNYEMPSAVYSGVCRAVPDDGAFIDACPATAVELFQSACENQPVDVVCSDGRNYKNTACAQCNGFVSFATSSAVSSVPSVFFGPCSTVISARTRDIVTTCPDTASAAEVSSCSSGATFVICGSDGNQYRNLACMRCNSASFSGLGLCGAHAQVEDGRAVISTCPASSNPFFATLCNTREPRIVCANGFNFKNTFCARCNGYSSEVTTSPCLTLQYPVVETCSGSSSSTTTTTTSEDQCHDFTPDPVCGSDGNSYINRPCAACNGLNPNVDVVDGACYGQEMVYEPCANVTCDINASCAKTLLDCDFETDMCGWRNSKGDDLQFQRHSGSTSTAQTGPTVDHTLNTTEGVYVFMDASDGASGHEAHLLSPLLTALQFGHSCVLEFYYHMWGADVHSLSVEVIRKQEDNTWKELWRVDAGNTPRAEHRNTWRAAHVDLYALRDVGVVQLRFVARRGDGPQGDVALDDVRMVCGDESSGTCVCNPGWIGDGHTCVRDPDEVVPTTAPPPSNSSSTNSTPATLSPSTTTQAATDTTFATTTSAIVENVVESCNLPGGIIDPCEYTAESFVCGDDDVTYKNAVCALCNGMTQVVSGPCTKSGDAATVHTCTDLQSPLFLQCNFQSEELVCADGSLYRNRPCALCAGYAEDKIEDGPCDGSIFDPCSAVQCVDNAVCTHTAADCDFEDAAMPLCGWTIDSDDGDGGNSGGDGGGDDGGGGGASGRFSWVRWSGPTPSSQTGPSVDHTLGNATGHYMYAEATGGSQGSRTFMQSPVFAPSSLGSGCFLEFWFHMFGQHVEPLTVQVREIRNATAWEDVWRIYPPANTADAEHDVWRRHATISLAAYTGPIQVRIVAERGSGIEGDVGIDDIRVLCSAETVGQCVCKEGYAMSSDGTACVPNILAYLLSRPDTQLALQLIKASGLGDFVASAQGLTLFAPSDAAVLSASVNPDVDLTDRDTLRSFVLHHLVGAPLLPRQLVSGQRLNTLFVTDAGFPQTLLVQRQNSQLTVNGATVTTPNLHASNGVIHIVDDIIAFDEDLCGGTECTDTQECTLAYSSNFTRSDSCDCPSAFSSVCAISPSGPQLFFSPCVAECLDAPIVGTGTCGAPQCQDLESCDGVLCDLHATCTPTGCQCALRYVPANPALGGQRGNCVLPSERTTTSTTTTTTTTVESMSTTTAVTTGAVTPAATTHSDTSSTSSTSSAATTTPVMVAFVSSARFDAELATEDRADFVQALRESVVDAGVARYDILGVVFESDENGVVVLINLRTEQDKALVDAAIADGDIRVLFSSQTFIAAPASSPDSDQNGSPKTAAIAGSVVAVAIVIGVVYIMYRRGLCARKSSVGYDFTAPSVAFDNPMYDAHEGIVTKLSGFDDGMHGEDGYMTVEA